MPFFRCCYAVFHQFLCNLKGVRICWMPFLCSPWWWCWWWWCSAHSALYRLNISLQSERIKLKFAHSFTWNLVRQTNSCIHLFCRCCLIECSLKFHEFWKKSELKKKNNKYIKRAHAHMAHKFIYHVNNDE